jgi:hypothetical protein
MGSLLIEIDIPMTAESSKRHAYPRTGQSTCIDRRASGHYAPNSDAGERRRMSARREVANRIQRLRQENRRKFCAAATTSRKPDAQGSTVAVARR